MSEFRSTHGLPFLSQYWNNPNNDMNWQQFKIGTVIGLWNCTPTDYQILSVINEVPHNGHLQDVFDWFENSCRRDKKNLKILEVINTDFERHLVNKRGFYNYDKDNLIKKFV